MTFEKYKRKCKLYKQYTKLGSVRKLMPKTEIIIPDEIIKIKIKCDNCSSYHQIRFIKNQEWIEFNCKKCKKNIVFKNGIAIL